MRKLFALAVFLALLCLTSCLFSQTKHFRGDAISITFPGGWNVEIFGLADVPMLRGGPEDAPCDRIFFADKSNRSFSVILDYYDISKEDFFTDENWDETLSEFQEKKQTTFIKSCVYWDDDTISIGEATPFETDFAYFVKVPVTIEWEDEEPSCYMQYYTLLEGKIIFFSVVIDPNNKKEELSEAEKIIQSFNDTGYYNFDLNQYESPLMQLTREETVSD